MRPGGDDEQVRLARFLHGLAHARLPDEQVRQADLVLRPDHGMQAGPAHVGVDEQHARSAERQHHAEVAGGRGLAFERLAAGDRDDPRPLRSAREDERRPQRSERFAEIVRHRLREQRDALAAHRRHQAEQRQPQPLRHIVGRLDRVVEVLDAERQAERDEQARHERGEPVAARVRRERRARVLRRDPCTVHVVRAAVADDPQLLLLLQERLIDLAVGLGLALQHQVAAALAVEVHRRALLRLELAGVAAFLDDRGFVLVRGRLDDACALRDERRPRALDLPFDLDEVRVSRQIPRRQPRLVGVRSLSRVLASMTPGLVEITGKASAASLFGSTDFTWL